MSKTAKRKAKKEAKALAARGGVSKVPDAKAAAAAAAKAALRSAADAVTAAFRSRRPDEALAAVEGLRAAGHVPTTVMINKLLTSYGRAGQWKQAVALLQQMRGVVADGPACGVRPTAVSYSAALLFAGQACEVGVALQILKDMSADGVAPDAVAYNAAISACRADAAARWRDAAALLSAARREGKADVVTHNAVLGVLDKAGQWQLASALLDEMCAAAAASAAGGPAGGIASPNAVSFASGIAACAAAKQPDAALRLLAAMPAARVAPSAHACNAALTACERAGRWEEALALLAKMESEGPPPDEVTVRSAVFACCSASPPRMTEALALFRRVEAGAFPGVRRNAVTQSLLVRAADMAGEGAQALALLSGFLRADGAAGGDSAAAASDAPRALTGSDVTAAEGRVVAHAIFVPPRCAGGPAAAPAPPAPAPETFAGQFHVIHHEPGWQRRPKNKHDLDIFYASPGMIAFDDDAAIGAHVARTDVPGVPGAFVLSGVLSGAECAQLVSASEAMGYARDEPTLRGGGAASAGVAQQAGRPAGEAARAASASASAGSAQDGIDNCVWLVDDSIMAHVWARVAPHLPPVVGGCALAGVNARWRLFRYAPGAVYRPHVDGAWPGSGVGADGRYVYDAYRDRWSRLTFLVYLNDSDGGGEADDGFGGGATVFYTPAPGDAGALDARGVAPRAGCVLCFPHGDAPGSLVHEGSAVLRGLKYVARTDVLYKLPGK